MQMLRKPHDLGRYLLVNMIFLIILLFPYRLRWVKRLFSGPQAPALDHELLSPVLASFFFLRRMPVRLSAWLNSLATLCGIPIFLAKAGSCAAPAMVRAILGVELGIRRRTLPVQRQPERCPER